MGTASLTAAEGNRDELATFSVVAEAIGIRHADEFAFHQRFALIEWRHDTCGLRLRRGTLDIGHSLYPRQPRTPCTHLVQSD